MKIYNKPSFPHQAIGRLGNKFLLYGFTGEVPADVSDIAFDIYDPEVLASEANIIVDTTATHVGQLIKFSNTVALKQPEGYAFDVAENKYRICPKKVSLSEGYGNRLNLTFATLYSQNSVAINGGNLNPVGHHYEFDFGVETSIDQIRYSCYFDSNYVSGNFELQMLVGEVWQTCENVSAQTNVPSKLTNAVLTQSYTAQKFRILFSKPTHYQYIGGFNFYNTTEPVNNYLAEDLTWFLLISDTTTYTVKNAVVIGNAGGPNGNKEVAFSLDKSYPTKEIKLMNFKLEAKPFGEIV